MTCPGTERKRPQSVLLSRRDGNAYQNLLLTIANRQKLCYRILRHRLEVSPVLEIGTNANLHYFRRQFVGVVIFLFLPLAENCCSDVVPIGKVTFNLLVS